MLPFPVPLAGDTVIQETDFDAVQPQFAVTEIVPLFPDASAVIELDDTVNDSALLPLATELYDVPAEFTAATQ